MALRGSRNGFSRERQVRRARSTSTGGKRRAPEAGTRATS